MSDDFRGRDPIILQPGDSSVPYTFTFTQATSATANTGSIPYGVSISSITVEAFDESGSTVTANIIDESINSSVVGTIRLNYPSTSGRYSIEMLLTLDNSAVMEFDFTRIYAMDLSAKR